MRQWTDRVDLTVRLNFRSDRRREAAQELIKPKYRAWMNSTDKRWGKAVPRFFANVKV
jgi:hypothetical protein